MRKITYKTIAALDVNTFDEAVNAAIAEGWEVSTVLNVCHTKTKDGYGVQYSIGCILVTDPAEPAESEA